MGGGPGEPDTTRRAYDLVTAGFGPGANGPLLLVAADPPAGTDPTDVAGTTGLRAASPSPVLRSWSPAPTRPGSTSPN
ncbi:hypothetical protein ABNF97_25060 [Plantactinospora sp. B6F1]|uniref:hypothetical protein n=1 Tax=Plantactinospora sp. B6F1 TaxID=3158971 RepID=UPI0032D8DA53